MNLDAIANDKHARSVGLVLVSVLIVRVFPALALHSEAAVPLAPRHIQVFKAILSLILASLPKSSGIFYSYCRHEKYVEINFLVLCWAKRMSTYSCLAGQSFLHWSGASQSIDALCVVSYSGSLQGCSDSKISLWTPPSLLKVCHIVSGIAISTLSLNSMGVT
jgi:hypothetical protein